MKKFNPKSKILPPSYGHAFQCLFHEELIGKGGGTEGGLLRNSSRNYLFSLQLLIYLAFNTVISAGAWLIGCNLVSWVTARKDEL